MLPCDTIDYALGKGLAFDCDSIKLGLKLHVEKTVQIYWNYNVQVTAIATGTTYGITGRYECESIVDAWMYVMSHVKEIDSGRDEETMITKVTIAAVSPLAHIGHEVTGGTLTDTPDA
jgi:hypothetical protein